jgi:hypothetical protein
MNHKQRYETAKQYLEMEDSKSFNGPRALAFRALLCHLDHGHPSMSTVLAVAEECGVRGFSIFDGLEEAPRTTE